MESFANRVDKVFGSLQVTSSWRLTPQDSQRQRLHKQRLPQDALHEEEGHEQEDEEVDDETPCWGAKPRGQQCSFDGMEVEGDLEEEGRSVRQMVGLDSTLDHEDEEDEFDKAAFGLDGSEEDRLYMKGIQVVDRKQNSSRSLPSSLYDLKKLQRDPRANHSAARARLEEDAKAATATNANKETINAAKVSDKDVRDMNENGHGVKRSSEDILVSREGPPPVSGEERLKPSKRVRFALDPQEPGDVKANTHKEFVRHKPSSAHASQVPDHVRNPSKYTHYTLDWSVEDNDMSNFQAFKACGETLQKVDEVSFFSDELPDKIQFVHKHDRTSSNPQKSNTEEANRSAMAISRTMCLANLESESGKSDNSELRRDDAMDFKTEDAASGYMIAEKPSGKTAKKYRTKRDPEEEMDD